ncbi:MAG: cyclophilin-like fold protein [Candidatus Nanopelagicales bacterium]
MTRSTTPRPRWRTRVRPTLAAALVADALLTAACSGQDPAPGGPTSPTVTEATPSGTPTAGTSAPSPTPEQGTPMDISITGAGVELRGTLDDTATARDFAALLPLTLALSDYAGTEKIADLPRRLNTTGAPAAHTGRPGDITYYAPWGNFALFYGNGPNAPGLIRLGRLESGPAGELADLNIEVTITRPN